MLGTYFVLLGKITTCGCKIEIELCKLPKINKIIKNGAYKIYFSKKKRYLQDAHILKSNGFLNLFYILQEKKKNSNPFYPKKKNSIVNYE